MRKRSLSWPLGERCWQSYYITRHFMTLKGGIVVLWLDKKQTCQNKVLFTGQKISKYWRIGAKKCKKVGNTVKFNSLTRHTMYEIPILTHQSSFSTPFWRGTWKAHWPKFWDWGGKYSVSNLVVLKSWIIFIKTFLKNHLMF